MPSIEGKRFYEDVNKPEVFQKVLARALDGYLRHAHGASMKVTEPFAVESVYSYALELNKKRKQPYSTLLLLNHAEEAALKHYGPENEEEVRRRIGALRASATGEVDL